MCGAREHTGGAKACAETERSTAVTARMDARSGMCRTCGARRGVVPSAARINARHGCRAGAEQRAATKVRVWNERRTLTGMCALTPPCSCNAVQDAVRTDGVRSRSACSVCVQCVRATSGAERRSANATERERSAANNDQRSVNSRCNGIIVMRTQRKAHRPSFVVQCS